MKLPRLWLIAPCLLAFAGCSTPPTVAPEIPPPPAALLMECPQPARLPDVASAREGIEWGLGWARNAACERARSFGLLEAWPR